MEMIVERKIDAGGMNKKMKSEENESEGLLSGRRGVIPWIGVRCILIVYGGGGVVDRSRNGNCRRRRCTPLVR